MLIDEPFGAVDEQTRTQLQDQLKQIHRKLGQTIVFVTHDIREAFRLGTRIVLIHNRSIVQEGTAEDLVFRPKTPFVRSFLSRQGFSALFDEAGLDKLYERVGQGKLDIQACLALLEQKKARVEQPWLLDTELSTAIRSLCSSVQHLHARAALPDLLLLPWD